MEDDSDKLNHLVEETKVYYRQRAQQYSDWTHWTGAYDGQGTEPDQTFYAEGRILMDALGKSRLTGDVLEVACGTGIWTEAFVRSADSVTALDSSLEMLERCKARLRGNTKVRFVHADFYEWVPDRNYDVVTFSFWISHVPVSKLEEFVSKVSQCLKPRGRVFFVDQLESGRRNETLERPDGEVATRTLDDGRKFRIYKHFYRIDEIKRSFARNGISTRISVTPTHFFIASGKKNDE